MHYFHTIVSGINVLVAAAVVLVLFTILAIIGIGESAIVAVMIFLTHLLSLSLLVIISIGFVCSNGLETFHLNWEIPITSDNLIYVLFLEFSAAMLGISGFESSANFVEEQQTGVFPKTLRNMWVIVSFFNPAIAILLIAVIPIAELDGHRESLLSYLGHTTGGTWLSMLIQLMPYWYFAVQCLLLL